jgi:hypothetical protein
LEELAMLVSQVLGALPFMTIDEFLPFCSSQTQLFIHSFSCCCYIFLSNYLDPEGTILCLQKRNTPGQSVLSFFECSLIRSMEDNLICFIRYK